MLLDEDHSRCESSNASFKVNSSGSNTLVQFLLCFDTSLESQRYRQRLAEFKSSSTPFNSVTNLAIEKHAFEIYTHAISSEVTKEIAKGKLSCYISNRQLLDVVEVFSVSHLNKGNETVNVFEVSSHPLICIQLKEKIVPNVTLKVYVTFF